MAHNQQELERPQGPHVMSSLVRQKGCNELELASTCSDNLITPGFPMTASIAKCVYALATVLEVGDSITAGEGASDQA